MKLPGRLLEMRTMEYEELQGAIRGTEDVAPRGVPERETASLEASPRTEEKGDKASSQSNKQPPSLPRLFDTCPGLLDLRRFRRWFLRRLHPAPFAPAARIV